MRITSKHLFKVFYGCLVLSILGGFFVHFSFRPHLFFSWQSLPFFPALYGFVACLIIILGSKAIGRSWLMKKEDYYESQQPKRGKRS